MSAHMKTRTTGTSTDISLTVPKKYAKQLCRAISSMLQLVDDASSEEDIADDELYEISEVFPESTPATRLRGLRAREGITQKELAQRLGIRQHHVSEMEKGTRNISVEMARKIEKEYNICYKVFL